MKTLNATEVKNLVNNLINEGCAVLAVKVTAVNVRIATAGELIETFLKNGEKETEHRCNGTEMVVTNPDGEVYAMPRDEFDMRYSYEEGSDVAYPLGKVRHLVDVPASLLPITFPAPWGGDMVLSDGYLNYDDMDGIYCIGRDEFNTTHRLCDETGKVL